MKRSLQACMLSIAATVTMLCANCLTVAAQAVHYVVANDNNEVKNWTSIFLAGGAAAAPKLTRVATIPTGGKGSFAAYLGSALTSIVSQTSNSCLFVSNGGTLNVAAIWGDPSTLIFNPAVVYHGSAVDSKSTPSQSLPIAASPDGNYLYVAFPTAGHIATFTLGANCVLSFSNDLTVSGLLSGIPIAMATSPGYQSNGSILVVAYSDGSIESFAISGGTPSPNGDLEDSTLNKLYASFPESIDITQDGHFAIFGDNPGMRPYTNVEIYNISSGHLGMMAKTYHGLGTGITGTPNGSANVRLSPDEKLLYVSNNSSGQVTALNFNKGNGQLTYGCTSPSLKNFEDTFYFTTGIAIEGTTGSGSVLWVGEDAVGTGTNAIGIVIVTAGSGGMCTLTESTKSPVSDPRAQALTSLSAFPLRPF